MKAVEDVSFDVRKGEILGIIGPNGAGKTTLFNLLNGFIPPNAGQRDLGQREPRRHAARTRSAGAASAARSRSCARFRACRCCENVVVGAFVAESDDEKAHRAWRAKRWRALGSPIARDSAGGRPHDVELRLMELARALASRPQLLLLDETLAGLGSQEVEHMLRSSTASRRAASTIVIIEHTMHAMVRLADRFVVLDHGAHAGTGQARGGHEASAA